MRVLVVDDSGVMRKSVSRGLQKAGFKLDQVMEACNGQEALEILELTSKIDFIFSDWNMPVMDGLELLHTVRRGAVPDMKNIPFFLVTAGGGKKQKDQATAAGVSGYIKKPFTPAALKTAVEKILNQDTVSNNNGENVQPKKKPGLLAELQQEHKIILKTLDSVTELGIDSPAGTTMLLSFKRQLTEHIKKEDEKMYPILQKRANSDKDLKKSLKKLRNDMADLKYFVRNFFSKYERKKKKDDFQGDFDFIVTVINDRIKLEENLIFKDFSTLIE